ncbi:PREDICTED: CUB and peptidase domain-containing protein 2-like isoform X2 [Acropora digitifera]|uniref:CUB and peptidase domain-containing protein 2-like isoform X2 n=1 Tax=Acropora digitifera TaxID=70779 RepID=UPI00077A9AF3|nr:PREDICTED: CUB and peptidase domain-containing protein 2-like isoform X2 [Acropora digitifera]
MNLGLIAIVIIFAGLLDAYDHSCGSVKDNSLTSPAYPSDYPSNMNCVYRVDIPFDHELLIIFQAFLLESHFLCIYDYLRITDDKNQTVGTYCGIEDVDRVVVVGSAAVLIFRSDSLIQLRGFHLSFTFQQGKFKNNSWKVIVVRSTFGKNV